MTPTVLSTIALIVSLLSFAWSFGAARAAGRAERAATNLARQLSDRTMTPVRPRPRHPDADGIPRAREAGDFR